MENKPKRSKAIIITIIAIIIFLIIGYWIFQNKDAFGVKTSATISKIFSPLISSNNSKNLNQVGQNTKKTLVEATENLQSGDKVSVIGLNSDNIPLAKKSGSGDVVFGSADENILKNDIGQVTLAIGGSNSFWNSFSKFMDILFNISNSNQNTCANGGSNYPICTLNNSGQCLNGATNIPTCTTNSSGQCINSATNPPLCTNDGNGCVNGTVNFPLCTITSSGQCINSATNPPMCTTIINGNGSNAIEQCLNGATNPPLCTTNNAGQCLNGATNPVLCTTNSNGQCINGGNNPPACTTINGGNGTNQCINGATNVPTCTTNSNGQCINGGNNPPMCTTINTNGTNTCINGATNPPLCTTNNAGQCLNGAINPVLCTTNSNGQCINGGNNPPMCTTINGGSGTNQCINNATNPPMCTTINNGNTCINEATNPPLCTTNNNGSTCLNGATNPTLCTINSNGECLNNATNPPLCTTTPNSECINNATNPPLCTTLPNGGCINNATNPPVCTVGPNGCINNAINPPLCTTFNNATPDLTVTGTITPTTATINTATTLSGTIFNIGGNSTEHSFSNYFSIDSTDKSEILTTTTPTLESGVESTATISYKFTTAGSYAVRLCADKNSPSDVGTVTESNENNNCGPITTIVVSNALPNTGDLPACSDTIDNDGDGSIDAQDPNCHINSDVKDTYVPNNPSESVSPVNPNGATECSDGIDNDGDGSIDAQDPECHLDSNLTKEYIPAHFSESTPPTTPTVENKCLLIEQNPLTFTDDEKARLAVLLRKFYLISSTLRTSEDITTTYNEIDQQKNFISQIEDLTTQCYAQVDGKGLMNAGFGWVRHGNPWYTKDTGGSYAYTAGDESYTRLDQLEGTTQADQCKVISGYYYGTLIKSIYGAPVGGDCRVFNVPNQLTFYGSCSAQNIFINAGTHKGDIWYDYWKFKGQRSKDILDAGCKWKDGVDLENTERILNIW